MKKVATILLAFLSVSLVVPLALAQDNSAPLVPNSIGPGQGTELLNPLGFSGPNSLEDFLGKILAYVIRIGTIVVVVMMVYVGYLFVTAQGKEEQIRKAREAFLWTVIGALIVLGSVAIKDGIVATIQALG